MKRYGSILFVMIVSASPAHAGKNAGGALIVHTNDDFEGWRGDHCTTSYDDPETCENAGTRSDHDGTIGQASWIWFIAAFPETSSPGVTVCYFGNDHNLLLDWITLWGFCGPAGSIEVPDDGWPDAPATAGNSIAFGSPVYSDFFPIYYFLCYSHAPDAYFGTGINPTGGYAGFVSDDNPPVLDEIDRFGQVHWFDDEGFNMCPEPPTAIETTTWGRMKVRYR